MCRVWCRRAVLEFGFCRCCMKGELVLFIILLIEIHSIDSDIQHYFSEMSHSIFGETEAVPSYRESFCWLYMAKKRRFHTMDMCGHIQ